MNNKFPHKFRPVLRYRVRDKKVARKVLDQKLWHQSGVVYARVYRNKVVYIGSTDRRLSRRIGAHLNYLAGSKRKDVARYRNWAEGKRITLLAFKPAPVKLFGVELYMHRAIEAALIKKFARPGEPDWFGARA